MRLTDPVKATSLVNSNRLNLSQVAYRRASFCVNHASTIAHESWLAIGKLEPLVRRSKCNVGSGNQTSQTRVRGPRVPESTVPHPRRPVPAARPSDIRMGKPNALQFILPAEHLPGSIDAGYSIELHEWCCRKSPEAQQFCTSGAAHAETILGFRPSEPRRARPVTAVARSSGQSAFVELRRAFAAHCRVWTVALGSRTVPK